MRASTASARTDAAAKPTARRPRLTPEQRADLRGRIVLAAVLWVHDQACSQALASLTSLVEQYTGRPVG